MMREPEHTLNQLKWSANRNLATKEGYQWYDIDFKNRRLVPLPNTKLDVKRHLIEPVIAKNVPNRTVLDLGCDKGYFSWYAMKCGAEKVIANDVNDKLEIYLRTLTATMGWSRMKVLNENLFDGELRVDADYVLALAMIHQVDNMEPVEVVRRIRRMAGEGALIEFCEDYQYKYGDGWNHQWFEEELLWEFERVNPVGSYDAIAEKKGKRYLYDCRCY